MATRQKLPKFIKDCDPETRKVLGEAYTSVTKEEWAQLAYDTFTQFRGEALAPDRFIHGILRARAAR
jgi:hypothetical protein